MHRRTFFKLDVAAALGWALTPLQRWLHMPVEFDDRGLNIIGNNVKAVSFYDDARVLRAQIYLDSNNALNISTTVVTSSTTATGAPAALESAQFLTLAADATLLGERVFTAGAGLTGADGGPGAAYTLAVGAGAGINVAADSVAIDTAANLAWTGNHVFQGALSTRTILPEATDTYDLGSSTKLWRKGWLAELDAVVFAQNTITLLGGWLLITKNEVTLPADVTAGATTINFGAVMTVGDFVLFRAAGAVEYVSVGTLVSGTTYNVTRNLDGSGANAWAAGTPGAVLGQTGNGRIELNAYDTPRISIIKQGATYNAQTETVRIGDLNGSFGISTELYGVGIGDYAAGNYLRYDPTNGFALSAGAGAVAIDTNGISLSTGTGNPNKLRWINSGTRSGQIYTNVSSDVQMIVNAEGKSGAARSQLQLIASYYGDSSQNSTLILQAGDGTSTNPPYAYVGNILKVGSGSANGLSAGDATLGGSIKVSTALGARVYNSAAFTHNATGTWVAVTFDSERFDNDTIHSTSSNTSRLTATTAGVYVISGTLVYAANATGIRGCAIKINGTFISSDIRAADATGTTNMAITTIYNLAAGDYAELFGFQNSGGNLNINAAANYSPEFSMVRIA